MSWTKAALVCLSAILVAGSLHDPLAAQAPPPVQVHGRVVDHQTMEPIDGATVTLLDSYGQPLGRRSTDEAGSFQFEVRNRAAARLRAGRIGYRDVTTPLVHFDGRTFFSVEIHLDVEAVLLAPLEIVARSAPRRSPVFSGFDLRARTGMGSYITRRDIEDRGPTLVTDLLAHLPGVRLEGGGRGNRRTVTMARTTLGPGGGACPVQVFLDGTLVTPRPSPGIQAGRVDTNVYIDDLVAPSAVEGIEVYRGAATVPPEFMNPNSRCGVVAIWTRRGQ